MEIPSPCHHVCRLDAAEICVGCQRSLAEIAGWSRFSEAEKAAVLVRVAIRQIGGGPEDDGSC
ncbi:MAG TPA: DUF1289 domain-containing protein [Verrucomicrobiae bacterium]